MDWMSFLLGFFVNFAFLGIAAVVIAARAGISNSRKK